MRGTGLVTVDEDNERHTLYLARRSTGIAGDQETVLVKFTPVYNKAVHLLLSEHTPPLAPALYSCTPVIGDMQMASVQAVRRDLAAALKVLHEKNSVFGEPRKANVLYSPEAGGRAFLVDFDGVGEYGMDRYSPCLNFELGLGESGWQIMEKSHDESNLEQIIKWLPTQ